MSDSDCPQPCMCNSCYAPYEDAQPRALPAVTLPDDVAKVVEEAEELLPDLQSAADDGDIDCKEAVRVIRVLITLATAQAAQIAGLEDAIDQNWITHQRVVSAETALAAERAKTARLVEALEFYGNSSLYDWDGNPDHLKPIERDAGRTALVALGYITPEGNLNE